MIITKKLIERLKNQDEEAFEIIYYEYEKLVYYICYSITNDQEASKDLTQDTFIRLLSSIKNYQHQGKFKQYLMEIARNLSKNYVTRVKPKSFILDEEKVNTSKDSLSIDKIKVDLKMVLDSLEYDIVMLKVIHKLKFIEIAEYLDLTIGKVQATYYNAIKKLK